MNKRKIIYTNYNIDKFERKEILDLDEVVLDSSKSVKWLEITSLEDINFINKVGKKFNLLDDAESPFL